MKIVIATTPIRPVPVFFPPVGSLSLINYLRKNGVEDVEFHHIDGNRPTYEDALARIVAAKPDIVGISSVVSTAYHYTKQLSLDIKAALPNCLIVVGGNLAASAEILLRRTGVDLCVLGEGEKVFLNIAEHAKTHHQASDFIAVPGLAVLDTNGKLVNTGYEAQISAAEVYDLDWQDLEENCDMGLYVIPAFGDDGVPMRPQFRRDARSFAPHRQGKNFTLLVDGKGCVAKCTFCHRWDKGMRYIPVETFMQRIDEVVARYNVGFLEIGSENFGSDRRWLASFFEEIKKRDVLWYTGAMRTKSVSPELIAAMKDAGCVAINYGMETGSKKILKVMEKKVDLQDNFNAQKWTADAGFETVVQLVLGMPGESPETIRETVEFCKYSFTLHPELNPNNLSINYAQALPGTPLYEYGRHQGLIGQDLDGEEEYLLRISDRDAHDEATTLNFTNYPDLVCQSWRPLINIEVIHAFVQKFGLEQYRRVMRGEYTTAAPARDDGYFGNPKRLVGRNPVPRTGIGGLISHIVNGRFGEAIISHPTLFYRLRRFLPLIVFLRNLTRFPMGHNLRLLRQYFAFLLSYPQRRSDDKFEYVSLRKIVWEDAGAISSDDVEMAPLRRGR
ncbi:MAG: B12-binding domain-containing radical SAM protein [Rhodospirillaceae bacterium]|jgi:radical SAM superfamily enzyme YgiQ (UPF0313 family)|nr:B12-binding domain-containing radical SAM protein [Rhodospirillaceae bacterium]MBT3887155.1 B12-binding domain-containing radical SAM protein [Rhodospirillaceae bacterium]MBT4115511.1 B12-binding domain-containing radical SAM protein [Rhodospirillaceae bacterium]MBT4673538.1 B12-binding domain-containing radical SAM protein [Rhodospirillaceae bacterium]MBT4750439.1 B12-binding domain-containing radical SAM protein [Rhodospirillaceae bacterium]